MKFSRLQGAIAAGLALAIAAACGGDSGGPGGGGPDTTGNGGGEGTMTARINGVDFSADRRIRVTRHAGGVYTIEGTANGDPAVVITLGMFNIGGTGTYPIGVGATIFGATASTSSAAQQWETPMDHSGTLTITELDASHIKGTFAFAALPVALGGATGLRTVSEGEFNVPLTGTYAPPTDAQGSSMVMDTSGIEEMVAATIIGSYHDTTLTFAGQTSRFLVTVTLKGVHGAGAYPLSTDDPRHTIVVGSDFSAPLADIWGGDATDTGTVTITSLTATRIQGSYSATLKNIIGTTALAPLTITGTFNLGMAQLPAPH